MAKKKNMPKGGRRGGTIFPRIRLKDAVDYARKLVAKTHTGPQPGSVILPGVFGSAGPSAKVKASALKQYDLMSGTPKEYGATELSKKIVGATPEEIPEHLRTALLKPKLFKTLFDTFCHDKVSIPRIKQQASNLKVHPDTLDECVQLFVDSACDAGLAEKIGDEVKFHASTIAVLTGAGTEDVDDTHSDEGDTGQENGEGEDGVAKSSTQSRKAGIANLEIKIDPSMDPEKLDKLLGVLKKYGQI